MSRRERLFLYALPLGELYELGELHPEKVSRPLRCWFVLRLVLAGLMARFRKKEP